jgi:hypothetical protein
MKSSSDWISGDASGKWDNGQPLDLDGNGWVRSLAPGQVARKLMLRDFGDRYPAGQYSVRYKGQGTLKFGFAASIVSQQPGQMVIQVTPSVDGGLYVYIEATNPADYLRDIQITLPGGICDGDPFTHVFTASDCGAGRFLSFADNSQSILFNPDFANRLRGYSVLRFMDWMNTNNNPVTRWSQRTPMSYSTWTIASGAPVEVMIALANLVGAHPWFNIPHQADDAYAQNFAQLVATQLNPNLSVYVEYSNEVWNSMFGQWKYANDQGAAQVPPIDGLQYHALRSRNLAGIFKSALGAQRIVGVLGAQAANPWTATHALDFLKTRFGSTVGIDAIAIAPYFAVMPGPAQASTYTGMTLDDFFTYVRTWVLPQASTWGSEYRLKVAKVYGVRLISYEGGQHMVGIYGGENDAALNSLFDAFNRDPRIKQLYLDYLNNWKQQGGELFVHFNDVGRYTKFGRWGALEYVAQPRVASPKFDAIQTFIEQNPVWWQ